MHFVRGGSMRATIEIKSDIALSKERERKRGRIVS